MTVPTNDSREQYLGNGATTVFPYAFKIFEGADLEVYLTEADGTQTLLVLGTDYTVTGAGNEDGGSITYPVIGDPLDDDETLTILRVIDITQETDMRNQGAYYPETIEDEFDRSRMIDQQIQEQVNRSMVSRVTGDRWDAKGMPIGNLGAATQDDDAASRAYVDERIQSETIGITDADWDGKGLKAKNFSGTYPPVDDELVTGRVMKDYASDLSAGISGDISTFEVGSSVGVNRTLRSWTDGILYSAPTLGDVLLDTRLKVGAYVQTAGYSAALGGGANRYVCVPPGTGTADGGRFVDHPNSPVQLKGLFPNGVNIRQFGATPDYDETTGTGTDNTPYINAALAYSRYVEADNGYYMVSGDGINLQNNGALVATGSSGYANLVGDSVAWDASSAPGFVLVPRNMNRSYTTTAMITECELSGGVLANPNAGDSYTLSSDGRLDVYRLNDFTNQDASGATAATAKGVSYVVKVPRGARCEGVFIRTTMSDGRLVGDSSDTNFGNQIDIGFLGENAFFAQLINCHASWAFRMFSAVSVQVDTGDGYIPQGDKLLLDRCFLEGHTPLGVRHYDTVRVSGATSTTIRVKWFKSHRFPASGSVRADGKTYAYSSLAMSGDDLVFSGLDGDPDADGVTAGDELVRGEDVLNYGTGGTTLRDCFLRSITHPALYISTDDYYTDRFDFSGKLFELSGGTLRGIHFEGANYFHSREDIAGWINEGGDVYINGYHEAKFTRAGGSAGRFIALSSDAKVSAGVPQPAGRAGQIHFLSWSQTEAQTDMTPAFRTSTSIGRFGTVDGLFSPVGTSNRIGYPYATGVDGTEQRDRLPGGTGSKHPKILLSSAGQSGTVRHSFDKDGRVAFGYGYDTDVDLPHRLCMYGGSLDRIAAYNLGGNGSIGFRAENAEGSVDLLATGGEGILRTNNVERLRWSYNTFRPGSDNTLSLGGVVYRWTEVRAASGTINTSDEREKTEFSDLSEPELNVARKIKLLIKKYKWLSAVAKKGEDGARWHFGVGAQSVKAAFEEEGLDAFDYGCLCLDEWESSPAEYDEDGNEIKPAIEAGSRYGVRPCELIFFMMAAM